MDGKSRSLATDNKFIEFSLLTHSQFMPQIVRKFDQIDSTNTALKKHLAEKKPDLIFITDYQTAGRGQYDKKWISPKGSSLLASIPINWPIKKANQIKIPAFIGLAVWQALKADNIKNLHLKLPNDIMLGNKKLAGILCERVVMAGNNLNINNKIIAGIGINLNQTHFASDIEKIAISIQQITNTHTSAVNMLYKLYNSLDKMLTDISQDKENVLWAQIKGILK